MYPAAPCSYCHLNIESDEYLQCSKCDQYFDIKCLKRPGTPGDLVGDVFFQFTCVTCSSDRKEEFVRLRIPWTLILVLTLYNLSINAKGLSHHGYFHWRTHIALFIEKNWNYLLGSFVKKKKSWTGTISGTLSHNTPEWFSSGQHLFQETGWWKLTHNKTPTEYYDLYKQTKEDKRKDEDIDVCSEYTIDHDVKRIRLTEDEIPCSRVIPYMGRYPYRAQSKSDSPQTHLQDDLDDFLEANCVDTIAELPLNHITTGEDVLTTLGASTNQLDWQSESVASSPGHATYEPRIVQVTNFQEADDDDDDANDNDIDEDEFSVQNLREIKTEIDSDDLADDEDAYNYPCEDSLFTKTTKRRAPWEENDRQYMADDEDADNEQNIELMSQYEEQGMLKRLRNVLRNDADDVPSWIRRFYRKLCVRELKRSLGKTIFDIDNIRQHRLKQSEQILDRFHQIICASSVTVLQRHEDLTRPSFQATLAGSAQYELFESPHTGRILHPFIYRNGKCMPPRVKLLCELQYKVNGEMPQRSTIDYCYLRPHHIAAVNGLLQKNFWPGIDMSECLSYPDFTIVALYKKLVIGCAFLVPDVSHNEAYVSFMAVRTDWQRAGIASFMMYHLTQTCMGRDITLHVSATNPAICFYQKFGFKIESFILDFYEKYLPAETSASSRHAFFLRLKR